MWNFGGRREAPNNMIQPAAPAGAQDILKNCQQLDNYINMNSEKLPIAIILLTLQIIDIIRVIASTANYLPGSTLHNTNSIVERYLPDLYNKYMRAHNNQLDETYEENKEIIKNVKEMLKTVMEIEKAISEDNKSQLEVETQFLTTKFEGSDL